MRYQREHASFRSMISSLLSWSPSSFQNSPRLIILSTAPRRDRVRHMWTGSVDHCDLSILEHDPVDPSFVRGAVEIVDIFIELRKVLADTLHKSGLTGAGSTLHADDLVRFALSQNMFIVREKSQRRVITREIMSFQRQGFTSLHDEILHTMPEHLSSYQKRAPAEALLVHIVLHLRCGICDSLRVYTSSRNAAHRVLTARRYICVPLPDSALLLWRPLPRPSPPVHPPATLALMYAVFPAQAQRPPPVQSTHLFAVLPSFEMLQSFQLLPAVAFAAWLPAVRPSRPVQSVLLSGYHARPARQAANFHRPYSLPKRHCSDRSRLPGCTTTSFSVASS